jgi:membrane protein DedA with SNARE-associated domain
VLANFFEAFATWAERSLEVLGMPGVALLALLENLFPPTPSEFLYPLAGKLAYDGLLAPWEVIIAGVVGSLAGSLLYYSLGYRLGAERTRRAIERYGRLRVLGLGIQIVTVEEYDAAVRLFATRGGAIVVVARIMPLVHSVVSIPAGVTHMRLGRFVLYTVVGSTLWIAPLTLLGWWLGSNWEHILYWMDVYEYAWYGVIALGVAALVMRRRRASRRRQVMDADL